MIPTQATNSSTRERLLSEGLSAMLTKGYSASGLSELLAAASVPKGSFYHYFHDKEDFGLQVLDRFATQTQSALDDALADSTRPHLARLQKFFESLCGRYEQCGCKEGCLLGTLAQELGGISDPFRTRIARHFAALQARFVTALEAAQRAGEVARETDIDTLAEVLINGWQGALIRMKIEHSIRPVERFIQFYFSVVRA